MVYLIRDSIGMFEDSYTLKVAVIMFLMFSGAFSLGLIADEINKRYVNTGRVWLALYIVANAIVIFGMREQHEFSLCLGIFLTICFLTVSSGLYDFISIRHASRSAITTRQYLHMMVGIIMIIFYFARYFMRIK